MSVLFADLVGFTSLSESRDAEEVRELLSRYFDPRRAVVASYGGIEKFIGDAVMAVWGAPVAQEDDAERAVRAGLDLLSAVAVPTEQARLGLGAPGGGGHGDGRRDGDRRGEGLVVGDLVNTAARIQSAAARAPSLSVGTRQASEDAAIIYRDAGYHELKGKAEPVGCAGAARRGRCGRGADERCSRRLRPPFVGRDRELRLVKDLFHGQAEENRAQLVSVTGSPGSASPGLAWEFYKYIDGLSDVF